MLPWDKLRKSLRKRGVFETLRLAFDYGSAPLAKYQPSRLAKRFSDWRYDLHYRVETSTAVDLEKLRIDNRDLRLSSRYQASTEKMFLEALAGLPIHHEEYVFIDFGSGKGKCLLMASDFPFRGIIGVEFSKELVDVADRNFQSYHSPRQRCRNLESVCCDATTYELPPGPGVYYLYNPFQQELLRRLRDNIEKSLARQPRKIYVVYHNPVHREVFDEASWLTLRKETRDYCVYVNTSADAPD